jgi:hypothetical protein
MMTEGVDILKGDGQFFALRVLNFSSPRSFSFTVFAKREGFINLFFLNFWIFLVEVLKCLKTIRKHFF